MTTAAHHRRIVLPAPPSFPTPQAPAVLRGLRAAVRVRERGRPALTGAAFGAVVGVLLTSGGMDPVAALTAGTGFGLAAGLLVPAPPPVPPVGSRVGSPLGSPVGPPVGGAPSTPADPSGALRP